MGNLEKVIQNHKKVTQIWKEKCKNDAKNGNKEKKLTLLVYRKPHRRAKGGPMCCVDRGGTGRRVAPENKKKSVQKTSSCGRRNEGPMCDGWCRMKSSVMSGHEVLPIMEDGEASPPVEPHAEDPSPSEDAAEHIRIVKKTSKTNSGRHDETCTRRFIRRELTWSAASSKRKKVPRADGRTPRTTRHSTRLLQTDTQDRLTSPLAGSGLLWLPGKKTETELMKEKDRG
ncbi:hypothetical protein RR46_01897 [Papilio xuthus]|uniref:Uncharacterized protein n=1 Tax=Papilio xuthus TaxID=66420 RepID=A0A194QG17_PAPXU|nr:hypothetical protein RR46_01897 [Papilio xuthus]